MQVSLSIQTIALAGVFQALRLVQDVARGQTVQPDEYSLMLNSIVNLNPAEAIDIYGGDIKNLTTGLNQLILQLGDRTKAKQDVELTRYAIGIFTLERRLSKTPAKLHALSENLQQLERQLQHFAVTDENIVARLADIYGECISTLGTRIQIYGQPEVLQQNSVQHKVRALLLTAIRSAVLWRQAGGSRLHFIFKRKKILTEAKQLLAATESNN